MSLAPLTLPPVADILPANAYLVGKGQRVDMVWSKFDFAVFCEILHNGNPQDHFLAAWNDKTTGQARFGKAPRNASVKNRASWAYDSARDVGKSKTSLGFYPTNPEGKSRWAALDFDAHDGEHARARRWSLEAFALLRAHPEDLYLVLCASGKGYHVFVLSAEFHPLAEWIALLKQVCAWIGAPIRDGLCEIFPNENAEHQRCGKGIRAPGTLNPKTGIPSLIEAETVRPLLDAFPSTWLSTKTRNLPALPGSLPLHNRTDYYSLTSTSERTEREEELVVEKYPIHQVGTRHHALLGLIGEAVHKFGREVSETLARRQFERYRSAIGSTLEEHVAEFATAWAGMVAKVESEFSPTESAIYRNLSTEHQREAFRLARSFASLAKRRGETSFPLAQASLASRLNITPNGVGFIIKLLITSGCLQITRRAIPHRSATLYRWLMG